MLRVKAIFCKIKRKLRVYYLKSSTTMKRILMIKAKVDKLMEEFYHEGFDADHIKDDMKKLIQEFQCKLSSKKAASLLEDQLPSSFSQRGPDHHINIIGNHDFSGECSEGFLVSPESGYPEGISEKLKSCGRIAVFRNWIENLPCLLIDITNLVQACSSITVRTEIAISKGPESVVPVISYLDVKYRQGMISSVMARTSATTEHWQTMEGTEDLDSDKIPLRVTYYVAWGIRPLPDVDLLIKSVVISYDGQTREFLPNDIIRNPKFENNHVSRNNSWSGRGCRLRLCSHRLRDFPESGFFVSTKDRRHECNGIEYEITGRVQRKLAYDVVAKVRIVGNDITNADVRATLWVQTTDLCEQYIGIGSVQATDKYWVELQGNFRLNYYASRVVIYLEGPPPGTDILLDNLVVKHVAEEAPPALPPIILQNAFFGVNIIANSNLYDGTSGWSPLRNCVLNIKTGSPYILPPMAADSLGTQEPLSGRYILVTNRIHNWDGPAQIITSKVKPYVTYQVSAWVRIKIGVATPQIVNVGIKVDNQWISGGKVEINDDQWNEIGGSFRIEKQPRKVEVCVQGPEGGIDFMVAGLQIFPVDRRARFTHLRKQTDRIRKRDVTLKFTTSNASTLVGTVVKIKQTRNNFPFGSCLNMASIDNKDFVDFFSKNFNWAILPEELKWFHTEREQKNFQCKDVNKILAFCKRHNIQLCGHSILQFQTWMRTLRGEDLGVLSRYKDMIVHYVVNSNGSFNQDKNNLNKLAQVFKIANIIDPSTTLFVNGYHVEDGCHLDQYVDHILDLQKQGAPIGGIGIKGHISSPIGPIVCDALNKLAKFGLPIWFTELDVSSDNDHVRADDIEVILREAFAHNAVKGIMLSGFWELLMNRINGHLVNADGEINEAGKRYLALKQEWLSSAYGHLDKQGRFEFRGFHGSYDVEVVNSFGKKVTRTFVIVEGEDPITITLNL